MKERNVKDLFLERIEALGGMARKVRWEGRNGAPDWRVMFKRTRSNSWVELKRPGEEPTPQQALEHQRLRDHGELVYVIDSPETLDKIFPLVLP